MKKVFVILALTLLLTGCSMPTIINDESVYLNLNNILNNEINITNTIFNGYKCYLPKGVRLVNKNDYNVILNYSSFNIYLYVDIISYYHKVTNTYVSNPNSYYSVSLNYNNKFGYLEINKVNDVYFIEMMYNYAKVEVYVNEEFLNSTLINCAYILNSLVYNDEILESLIGDNVINYKEENFSIFEPKRETGDFLDYVAEYDNYEKYINKNNDDEDIISSSVE